MNADLQLVRRASFEIGELVDWSVTDDAVALLSGSTVSLVSDERDEITLNQDARKVAINDQLFVLFDEELAAYGRSGTRLWRADIPGGERIAAPDDTEYVVVLTDDDRLVGVDATTGGTRFEQDRPDADVAATPELVSTASDLVLASWSYLTVLEPDGETRMRTSLDGAISGLGVVDGVVVCVMKDDRCVGVDLDSGERLWKHDWAVDRIDPHGSDELFVQTAESVRAVAPNGEWRSLSLQGGMPVAAVSGNVVCMVDGAVANVFEAVDPSDVEVDATVGSEEIGATAESLPVVVENVGGTVATVRVGVEVEGATTVTGDERLSLDPGEREGIRVSLGSIRDDRLQVSVTVDGEVVLTRAIEVLGGVDDLGVTATPVQSASGWDVRLDLSNPTPVPIHDVRIEPSGRVLSTLDSDEERSVTVSLPQDHRVRLHAAGEQRRVEVSVPERPLEAEIGFDDGLVRVTVTNDGEATVEDVVSVTSPALPNDLSVPVEANAARTVIGFPPTEGGNVPVSVEGEFLDSEATVDVPDDAVLRGQPREPQPSSSGAASGSGLVTEAQTGVDVVGGDDSPSGDGADLELAREFEPERSAIGHLVFEYVNVTNAGSGAARVSVTPADGEGATERIPPGESRRFVRAHTFTDREGTVPSVAVETAAGRRVADEYRMTVEQPEFYCLAKAHPGRGTLQVRIVNESPTRLTVSDLTLSTATLVDPPEEVQVPPRSRETLSMSAEGFRQIDGAELLSFSTGSDVVDGRDRGDHQTLVHVAGSDEPGLSQLDLHVDDETVIDDGSGTIVVRITNDGPVPLEGLTVEAGGDQLRPILYDPLKDVGLASNETTVHYVDVEGLANRVEVPLTLGVGDEETTATIVGDPTDPDSLRVTRDTDGGGDGLPSRISSPVELVE